MIKIREKFIYFGKKLHVKIKKFKIATVCFAKKRPIKCMKHNKNNKKQK